MVHAKVCAIQYISVCSKKLSHHGNVLTVLFHNSIVTEVAIPNAGSQ